MFKRALLTLCILSVPGNAQENGCLGQSLQQCSEFISARLKIATPEILQHEIADLDKVDINGKRIGRAQVEFFGYLPGFGEKDVMVAARLTPDKMVKHLEANLVDNPKYARTEEEYDRTALFEVMQLLFGTGCPDVADKVTTYKWFENRVKPTLTLKREDPELDMGHAREGLIERSKAVKVCGRTVSYTHISGYDTNDISLTNPHGVYSRATLDVE